MNFRNFFVELKRRNVYKVAVAYAVVAWLLIQIATQVFPFFEIPNWAVRLVVLLLGAKVTTAVQESRVDFRCDHRGRDVGRFVFPRTLHRSETRGRDGAAIEIDRGAAV